VQVESLEVGAVAWTDRDAVRRLVEVTNAARRVDSPWVHPMTEHECVGELRHGWDGEPGTAFVAAVDGVDVAVGWHHTSTYDNQHLAWLEVEVVPELRRRRHGSALLEHLVDRARSEGRTTVGAAGWDATGAQAFAGRHGFAQKSVEVHRRQYVVGLDWTALDRLHDETLGHAAAYELVRWPSPTPEADLAGLAELTAAINDAPTDDLDVEDEVFPPERIAAYEHTWEARGHRLYRVVARHRESGRLAGQSVVAVDGERPELAEQHDTSVVAAHRGHRLGLLLKLEMLGWLSEDEPQVREIDTWNAESNDHMIGVNEILGYRVLGRVLDFQRSL
jgi:GNAT superfamily N-acetyltransferase/RimJ/RimL family protein N-acetyltransferase